MTRHGARTHQVALGYSLPMRASLIILALGLTGCLSTAAVESPRADLAITSGTSGRLASSENPGRRRAPWIEVATDHDRFIELWQRYVPGDPEAGARQVVFERNLAVFLLLGPQSTGGYAIEPIDVEVEGGVIRVHAKLVQPMTPGDFTTQAITAPYAVVRAPAIPFDRIEWVDADGRILATRTAE